MEGNATFATARFEVRDCRNEDQREQHQSGPRRRRRCLGPARQSDAPLNAQQGFTYYLRPGRAVHHPIWMDDLLIRG
jgi:hypothetical protein